MQVHVRTCPVNFTFLTVAAVKQFFLHHTQSQHVASLISSHYMKTKWFSFIFWCEELKGSDNRSLTCLTQRMAFYRTPDIITVFTRTPTGQYPEPDDSSLQPTHFVLQHCKFVCHEDNQDILATLLSKNFSPLCQINVPL